MQEKPKSEFEERVIAIDRVSRTVKGGKRMRFRALVVIGDRAGRVGAGIGKGVEVPLAVAKATTKAKKSLIFVPQKNETIAYAVSARFGTSLVQLWPASEGTSIIAGGPVRAVVELSGIRNILAKLHGSTNKVNAVQSTLAALSKLRKIENKKLNVEKIKSAEQAEILDSNSKFQSTENEGEEK